MRPGSEPEICDTRGPGSGAWRLHRHADYQRVYQQGSKQFASLLTYFAAARPSASESDVGASASRVGITAGRVLGKAVERNRIKRRMRAAIVCNLDVLPPGMDVVLHPRRSVLTAEWPALRSEVRRIFTRIARAQPAGTQPAGTQTAGIPTAGIPIAGTQTAGSPVAPTPSAVERSESREPARRSRPR